MTRPAEGFARPSISGPRGLQAALAVALEGRFVVTTVSTVSEGLHWLAVSRLHLVVLDASLPDLKSMTFLRALRAHRPACPVIVLTDSEEGGALSELLDLRVDGLFPPSNPLDVLLRRIDALLGIPPARAQ